MQSFDVFGSLSDIEKGGMYAMLGTVFLFNFHATYASANRGKGASQLPAEVTTIHDLTRRHYEVEGGGEEEDEENRYSHPHVGIPTDGSLNSPSFVTATGSAMSSASLKGMS